MNERMITHYGLVDMDGYPIADGLEPSCAHQYAQDIANSRGEAVELYPFPLRYDDNGEIVDEGEIIEPEEIAELEEGSNPKGR